MQNLGLAYFFLFKSSSSLTNKISEANSFISTLYDQAILTGDDKTEICSPEEIVFYLEDRDKEKLCEIIGKPYFNEMDEGIFSIGIR